MVRGYLYVLMGGLFLQGLGSLLFRLISRLPETTPLLVRGAFGIDFSHAWVHIMGCRRDRGSGQAPRPQAAAWLALVFGVCYTSFGILGVSIYHPLGLQIDAFENTFHLTAGPLTLLIGAAATILPATVPRRAAGEPAGPTVHSGPT